MGTEERSELGWCILELMGHRKLAGYVTEHGPLFRIDVHVPGEGDDDIEQTRAVATQLYAPAALYCITPTTQEVCLRMAERYQPEPVSRWELPAPREPQTVPDVDAEIADDDFGAF